jgi:hypothetical protein
MAESDHRLVGQYSPLMLVSRCHTDLVLQYGGSLDSSAGREIEKLLPSLRAKSVAMFERTYRLSSSMCVSHIFFAYTVLIYSRIIPD